MAEPRDLLNLWQDVIKQMQGAAGTLASGSTDIAKELISPLQRQAELLEKALASQEAFEREVLGRVFAPGRVVIDMLEQTSTALRTQAKAFEAASASFKQTSELLVFQASLLDKTVESLRDPVELLKNAGGVVRSPARADD